MCVIVGCSNNEYKNNTPTHTNHNWSITYTDGGDQHYQTCDGCDEIKYSDHDYTNGNCVCGKENPNSVPDVSAKVLKVDGASIDGNNIFMLVDHSVDSVSLADKVICSSNNVWRLYYDKLGQTEIPTKIATSISGELIKGNNIFYLVVTSQNGAQTNLYELIVHRSYAVNINFYNDDSIIKTDTAFTGYDYTVSYTPNIDGYTFNYWNSENGNKANDKFTIYGEVSFYANKTAKQYTASFDVDGGDELQTNTQTVTYDSNYIFAAPTRTGYSFLGWYDGATQVTDKNGTNISVWNYTKNKTLVAKWKANTYTLTAVSDNPSGGTVAGGGDYKYDSIVTLTAMTKSGYTFIGWYDESGDKISSALQTSVLMGFDETYMAKWIKVTLTSENTVMGTVSSLTETYMPGDNVTAVASTNIGYLFLGWYRNGIKLTDNLEYTFEMPSANAVYNAKWELDDAMSNFNFTSTTTTCEITSEKDLLITDITIPDYVTSIGNRAFLDCNRLTYIKIGSGVKSIGSYAFGQCSGITSITIPDSVTIIKDSAFINCKSLMNVTIGNGVNTIESGAFERCSKLESIKISESVTSLGSNAFFGCFSLKNVTIPDELTFIGNDAFYDCNNLTGVYISDIDAWYKIRFSNSAANPLYYAHNLYENNVLLSELVIPDSITSISNYAFCGCTSLTNVTIGTGVNKIGLGAFRDCDSLIRVAFKNTSGWQLRDYIDHSIVKSLNSSDLMNASTAMTYLSSTYCNYIWSLS